MYKKIAVIGFAVCACAVVLTACTQETIATRLNKSLLQANSEGTKIFGYNPDLELVPTKMPEGDLITISAHGYGANKKTGKYLAQYAPVSGHVLTLNLPDHDYKSGDEWNLRHGSIDEILPLAFAVQTAITAGAKRINLYGFSAGGGAIINLLGMLNSSKYDAQLSDIGIAKTDKDAMLGAIERGTVILDAPLKSVEEIIHGRGATEELVLFAQKYKENNLRPIDTLAGLQGLNLKVLLYFENPDNILYNRDDAEFIKRLEAANILGTTRIVFGANGGHSTWHKELWQAYQDIVTKK